MLDELALVAVRPRPLGDAVGIELGDVVLRDTAEVMVEGSLELLDAADDALEDLFGHAVYQSAGEEADRHFREGFVQADDLILREGDDADLIGDVVFLYKADEFVDQLRLAGFDLDKELFFLIELLPFDEVFFKSRDAPVGVGRMGIHEEFLEFGEGEAFDVARTVGGAADIAVVHDDNHAVLGDIDVVFHDIRAGFDGKQGTFDGVFRVRTGHTAVTDDVDLTGHGILFEIFGESGLRTGNILRDNAVATGEDGCHIAVFGFGSGRPDADETAFEVIGVITVGDFFGKDHHVTADGVGVAADLHEVIGAVGGFVGVGYTENGAAPDGFVDGSVENIGVFGDDEEVTDFGGVELVGHGVHGGFGGDFKCGNDVSAEIGDFDRSSGDGAVRKEDIPAVVGRENSGRGKGGGEGVQFGFGIDFRDERGGGEDIRFGDFGEPDLCGRRGNGKREQEERGEDGRENFLSQFHGMILIKRREAANDRRLLYVYGLIWTSWRLRSLLRRLLLQLLRLRRSRRSELLR